MWLVKGILSFWAFSLISQFRLWLFELVCLLRKDCEFELRSLCLKTKIFREIEDFWFEESELNLAFSLLLSSCLSKFPNLLDQQVILSVSLLNLKMRTLDCLSLDSKIKQLLWVINWFQPLVYLVSTL